MQFVYSFDTQPLPRAMAVGSKALGLMQTRQAGFLVPDGFVLTTAFFDPWFTELGSAADMGACGRLRLDQAQRAAFTAAMESLTRSGSGDRIFAVRSSSPDEDLAEASFAGGYETILGVPAGQLEAAVLQCFASYFGQRAEAYRQKQGLSAGRRHAVIVQEQIDAEVAGVAFSINPVNNSYDEAVINANDGLGESVVSGDAEPDYFLIDKVGDQILETRSGSKRVSVMLAAGGGTVSEERAPSQTPCLSQEQVLQIVDLVKRAEAHYGYPVDIEWAISQDRLYLLQVRPITTHYQLPPQMITAPGEPKFLYANSTLVEQGLQEPLSVLGTEFVGYILRSMGRVFGDDAAGSEGMAFTAGGRYYMNLSYGIKVSGKNMAFAPGSMGDETLHALLDQIDMAEYLSVKLPDRLSRLQKKMILGGLPLVPAILRAFLWPHAFVRQFQKDLPVQVRRFDLSPDDPRPLPQLAEELSSLLDFFNIKYGIPLVLAAQLAQQRIRRLFDAGDPAIRDALADLGAALPGNKTAEMGELMFRLAAAPEIQTTATAALFLDKLQRQAFSGPFTRDWGTLVVEFGARCPGEIDAATPRPSEDPAGLFDKIKALSLSISADSDPFERARRKREAAYQTLSAAARKGSALKARAFSRYYRVWAALGGYRETPKHYIIKAVAAFRQAALARAAQLVRDGRLDNPQQIFDLTMADIEAAWQNPGLNLRHLAQERSAFIKQARTCKLVVRIIDSRGKVFYPMASDSAQGQLTGISISAGVVRGRVKVMRTAYEKPLLPGEILVARATDPGWTPLFVNAGGIILEIGGVLQHGAVVAREYGIPCVSGITRATEILQDGQLVELDASHGIVRLIEEPA